MARVYEQKSTTPSGKGNGVKHDKMRAAPRKAAVKSAPAPATQDQGTNEFAERNYMRLSKEQERIIAVGTARMHEAIEPWGELRSEWEGLAAKDHGQYKATVSKIKADLRDAYSDMRSQITSSDTTFTLAVGASNTRHYAINEHPMAAAEIARQLNRGYFPVYYKEFMTMHSLFGLPDLTALMAKYAGVEIANEQHEYTLKTIVGVEGAIGEGVSFGGALKQFSISYRNDLGMKWTRNVVVGYGKGGAGVSGSPIEANIDTSYGTNALSAGSARSHKYYPPSHFDIGTVSGASAGTNIYSAGVLQFGDLSFSMTGASAKLGTAMVPGVGSEVVPLGGYIGGSVYKTRGLDDAKEVQETKREDGWFPAIHASIYFRTEEMGLDKEDHRSLDRVANAIANHDRYYPGDPCKIHTLGYASEAWATPVGSARNYQVDTGKIDAEQIGNAEKSQKKRDLLNRWLAASRAFVVKSALEDKLAARKTLAKINYVSYKPQIIKSDSPAADRNEPTDRYVRVRVEYPKNEPLP